MTAVTVPTVVVPPAADLIFVRIPGDEDSDPSYELQDKVGNWMGISIQDARAYGFGFRVVAHGAECTRSPLAGDYWCEEMGEFKSLAKAKERALAVFRSVEFRTKA